MMYASDVIPCERCQKKQREGMVKLVLHGGMPYFHISRRQFSFEPVGAECAGYYRQSAANCRSKDNSSFHKGKSPEVKRF